MSIFAAGMSPGGIQPAIALMRRQHGRTGVRMAIVLVFEGAGVTQAQYDQVRKEVMPDNKPAAGMLYHVGAPMANGWRVVEVWESQAAADQFFQDKLGKALQKANINVKPEVTQAHNIIKA